MNHFLSSADLQLVTFSQITVSDDIKANDYD
jgi:hypothetical protein